MKVEGVSQQKESTNRFAVLFEDGTEIKVSAAQISDFGIFTGRILSEDEYNELRKGLELGSSKARALRILGSRRLSSREMERRLTDKGESAGTASQTVRWLEDIGAINDTEFAYSIVSHYSAKGYGAARIKDELHKRGIDREMWDEALEGAGDTDESAYVFVEKKLRGSRSKDDLRRVTDALRRRGFSYGEARSAVNRYLECLEDSEENTL